MLVRIPIDEPNDQDCYYPEVVQFEVVPNIPDELASYLRSFKSAEESMQKEGWGELHEILVDTDLNQCALYRDPETEELVEFDDMSNGEHNIAVCIDDFDLVLRGKTFILRGYGGDHMALETCGFTLDQIQEALACELDVFEVPYPEGDTTT